MTENAIGVVDLSTGTAVGKIDATMLAEQLGKFCQAMDSNLAYSQKSSVLPLSMIEVFLAVSVEFGLSAVLKGTAEASIKLIFQHPSGGAVEQFAGPGTA